MLGWIIAAAGLWRGLTPDEVDAVADEVQAQLTAQTIDPDAMTARAAQDMLTAAMSTVLDLTRR